MKNFLVALFVWLATPTLALAIAPYVDADPIKGGEIHQLANAVEAKLKAAGFQPLGQYCPPQLSEYCVVVVTDESLLNEIRRLGGANIVGAAIRIGIKSDGAVSYMNPDYWYRAYFRSQFPQAEQTVQEIQTKLARVLGSRGTFGGDVSAEDLPRYRYLIGMERFDSDKNVLARFNSFEDAVKVIRSNLDRGVAHTRKVYEVVMPEKKIAVFGVAMNDETLGDGRWLAKIGADDEIAALPYELYVVDDAAQALFGRFRIALAFPDLSMGHFMRIAYTPNDIVNMLTLVAGGIPKP
ncbi:MAG: hypothetical protein ACLPXB_09010 [Thiobacillaceae bacterium]